MFVESIKRFVVTLDDASANALAGDEVPLGRGDDEPLLEDAVPLEPMPDVKPDDDGCSCCHGGIISLLLSKRFASSNVIFFLSAINCLARKKSIKKPFVSFVALNYLVQSLIFLLRVYPGAVGHLELNLSV